MHAEVKGLMRSTFETFKADGDDVQREWSAFVSRVDQNVEDALRQVPTGHPLRGYVADARPGLISGGHMIWLSLARSRAADGEEVAAGALEVHQRRREDRRAGALPHPRGAPRVEG